MVYIILCQDFSKAPKSIFLFQGFRQLYHASKIHRRYAYFVDIRYWQFHEKVLLRMYCVIVVHWNISRHCNNVLHWLRHCCTKTPFHGRILRLFISVYILCSVKVHAVTTKWLEEQTVLQVEWFFLTFLTLYLCVRQNITSLPLNIGMSIIFTFSYLSSSFYPLEHSWLAPWQGCNLVFIVSKITVFRDKVQLRAKYQSHNNITFVLGVFHHNF